MLDSLRHPTPAPPPTARTALSLGPWTRAAAPLPPPGFLRVGRAPPRPHRGVPCPWPRPRPRLGELRPSPPWPGLSAPPQTAREPRAGRREHLLCGGRRAGPGAAGRPAETACAELRARPPSFLCRGGSQPHLQASGPQSPPPRRPGRGTARRLHLLGEPVEPPGRLPPILAPPRLVRGGGRTGDGGRDTGLACRQQPLEGQGPQGLLPCTAFLRWSPLGRGLGDALPEAVPAALWIGVPVPAHVSAPAAHATARTPPGRLEGVPAFVTHVGLARSLAWFRCVHFPGWLLLL